MPGCRLRSRAIALVGLAAVPAATEVRPFRLRPNRSRAGLKTDAPLDGRAPGLRRNLNSALIFDQKSDLAAKKFAEGKVVWTVRAPHEPGTYSIAAAFHFGSERASAVGTVTTATGQVFPRGGPAGASARVMFAKPVIVTVR